MVYQSGEMPEGGIFVCPFPNVKDGKWQISSNGGVMPQWSWDGKEIIYISNNSVMSVKVATSPTFEHGTPEELFKRTLVGASSYQGIYIPYHISRDGKRFLMLKQAEIPVEATNTELPDKITIVLNWDQELKEKVPVP